MITRCLGCMEQYDSEFGVCPFCGYVIGTPAEEATHLVPGTILHDRYLIGKALGYGGFGVTYIAWDSRLEQKVAIKEYLPSEFSTRMPGQSRVTIGSGDKSEQFHDGLDKFVDEARRLAKFSNEAGIVRIFDSFKANDTAYIVMEYLEGETLSDYLNENGVIDEDTAIDMLLPVMRSLETVHEAGLIHRDIAPDNIFITKTGEIKLIDFGAARYATTKHSRSLTVIIKQGYSPEEQYRSRGDQGPHTDVYSLGATLYKMITGTTPPDALERRAQFEGKGKDTLVEPHKLNKKISANTETAILNAMNVRIQDRTPDVKTFAEELLSEKPIKRRYGKIKKIDIYSWPLWAKIGIPALLAVVLTFGVLLLTGVINFSKYTTKLVVPDNIVITPDLEGMDKNEAISIIEENSLLASTGGTIESEYIPAGTIIMQQPVGGSFIDKNGTVMLTISSGSGVIDVVDGVATVPYVIWDTEEDAVSKILQAGLASPHIEYAHDDNVSAGQVISTDPEAGTELPEGSVVKMVVSIGPEAFEMPDVTGNEEGSARNELESKGLVVSVSYENNSNVPEGHVISQSIDPGTNVYRGDEVLLIVSSGKPTIVVADVVGKARADAENELKTQGFKVAVLENYSDTVPAGYVISQSPAAGQSQIEGATITIYVSKGPQTVSVTGISLNKISLSLVAGNNETLVATVHPDNATEKAVTWSSDNTSVAAVDSNGKVTAKSAGTATITVTTVDGGKRATCTVTVTNAVVSVTGVTLNRSTLELTEGQYFTLVAQVQPTDATNQNASWKSSNSSIASVDSTGKVTARSAGTATITVTTADGGKTATCTVTVKQAVVHVTSVTLNKSNTTITVGQTETLIATVLPANATNKNVTWSTSNSSIATVDQNGKVTARAAGTAVVTVTTVDGGKTASCTVNVINATIPVTGVTLNVTSLTLDVGQSQVLTATVLPTNATNKSVTWSSSNSSVASVNSNGRVTAVSSGQATITVRTVDGGKTATCVVTVRPQTVSVTGVTLNTNSISLHPGENYTLVATVLPSNATNKSVTWSSSNASVATVNSNGKVTAVGGGSATITVRTNDGGFTANCQVSVIAVTPTPSPSPTPTPTVVRIEVNTLPTRTYYYKEDVFETDGLSITCYYSNGTTNIVYYGYTWSPTILYDSGTQRITVEYEGQSTSFTVEVDHQIAIRTAYDLAHVRKNEDYILLNDIDLSSWGLWTPLSFVATTASPTSCYNGVFDGNGHTISNLNVRLVKSQVEAHGGLFAGLQNATVKNLTIRNGSVYAESSYNGYYYSRAYAGAICGCATDTNIINCVNNNTAVSTVASDDSNAGGIAGRVEGTSTISYCSNSGQIFGAGIHGITRYIFVGGITGSSSVPCQFSNCSNSGSVSLDDSELASGYFTSIGNIVGYYYNSGHGEPIN